MRPTGKILSLLFVLFSVPGTPSLVSAMQWDEPASELVKKIATRLAPQSAVTLMFRNTSDLSGDEATGIRRALEAGLRQAGLQLVDKGPGRAEIRVTLSENSRGYLWIADIQNESSRDVVMVPVERRKLEPARDPAAMITLQRTRLIESELPILDVISVAGQSDKPKRLVVLHPHALSFYELPLTGTPMATPQSVAPIAHSRPWPRDTRGRLLKHGESRFDAYLPGVVCTGSIENALTAECHDSEEWWPLVASDDSATMRAEFIADRNYFDGRVTSGDGREITMPSFFAGTWMVGESPMWVIAGLDGKVQSFRKDLQPITSLSVRGSELAGIKTRCGSGAQLLATSDDSAGADSIRAYEVSTRGAVPVSEPLQFGGVITALWPAAGDMGAVAISHDLKSDRYEASFVSIACAQ